MHRGNLSTLGHFTSARLEPLFIALVSLAFNSIHALARTIELLLLHFLLTRKNEGNFWVPLVDLAGAVEVSPGTVHCVLSKCEAAGLVHSREAGPHTKHFFLSSAGERLLMLQTSPASVRLSRERESKGSVFVSHASDDARDIARPLAENLQRHGLTVWLDEEALVLGDSLRQSIEHGLANTDAGVVILSRAFFTKQWTQRELDGLYARLISGQENVLIPIWHNLTHADVVHYAPMLADLFAGDSSHGIGKLTVQIERAVARRQRLK
jgi:hypothetical protein